jgi:hypothetical protein
VIAAALGSTVLAWVMWAPFTDPSRIYYGTDTRAVALLVGVALALIPWGLRDRSAWPAARCRALDVVPGLRPRVRDTLSDAGRVRQGTRMSLHGRMRWASPLIPTAGRPFSSRRGRLA